MWWDGRGVVNRCIPTLCWSKPENGILWPSLYSKWWYTSCLPIEPWPDPVEATAQTQPSIFCLPRNFTHILLSFWVTVLNTQACFSSSDFFTVSWGECQQPVLIGHDVKNWKPVRNLSHWASGIGDLCMSSVIVGCFMRFYCIKLFYSDCICHLLS